MMLPRLRRLSKPNLRSFPDGRRLQFILDESLLGGVLPCRRVKSFALSGVVLLTTTFPR